MKGDGAVRFRVTATIPPFYGFHGLAGRLDVLPTRLVLHLDRRSQQLAHVDQLVDEHRDVRVVLSRLIPQLGVHVVLTDNTTTAVAIFARWHYRRFATALERSGIVPQVRTAWFWGGPEHQPWG